MRIRHSFNPFTSISDIFIKQTSEFVLETVGFFSQRRNTRDNVDFHRMLDAETMRNQQILCIYSNVLTQIVHPFLHNKAISNNCVHLRTMCKRKEIDLAYCENLNIEKIVIL